MKYRYFLRIAELCIGIYSPAALEFPACFHPFTIQDEQCCADEVLEVDVNREIPDSRNADEIISQNLFRLGGKLYQKYFLKEDRYILRVEPEEKGMPWRLEIPVNHFEDFRNASNWLPFMALERILLRHDRMILHSSSVCYENKGYLFCAPSGGGKSTQAELWRQTGAEVINGDKTIIGEEHGVLKVYGGPAAGTSGIYRNVSAPLETILILQKDTQNEMTPMHIKDALLALYSSSVKSIWDTEYNGKLLDLIGKTVGRIPVYHLKCKADSSAVAYAQRVLKGQKNG